MVLIKNGLKIKDYFMECLNSLNKNFFLEKKIELNSFIYVNEINDDALIDNLIIDSKKKLLESTLNYSTNVFAKRTNFDALVNNFYFNIFLKKIQKDIFKIYQDKFIIKEVWANFYRDSKDHAKMHNHRQATAFCGILYCTDSSGPGTFFPQYNLNVLEKKGRYVLFSPILDHEVKPCDFKGGRITIAWNFDFLNGWDNKNRIYI